MKFEDSTSALSTFNRLRPVGLIWMFVAVLAASSLGAAATASAAVIPAPPTFAQFHETTTSPSPSLFAYLDNGGRSDAELVTAPGGNIGAAIPVVFNYLAVTGTLPPDLAGDQAATLSMTSSTLSPANTFASGLIGQQLVDGSGSLSNTITITRDAQAAEGTGTRTNLLTVTFTAQLLGAMGGATPQLSADTTLGFTVNYSSDFLTFSNGSHNFSLTFSSWSPGLSLSTLEDNYFANATAAGAGTFAAGATVIPEPSTLILALGSFSALCMRRRSTKNRR